MSRSIEEWLNQIYKASEFRAQITLEEELDDSFSWGTRLRYLITLPRTERPAGLLLVGPPGCGKRYAASHVVQGMQGRKAGAIFLSGSELSEGCDSFQDLKARLNAVLDRFYDEQAELLLILEEPGDCEYAQELYGFLGITALEYARDDSLPRLFLVLTFREEPKLPSLLRSRLQRCRLDYPNREERMRFLLVKGKGLRNTLSLDELAEATEGKSYTEIYDIIRNLELITDVEERIPSSQEVRSFLDRQAVAVPAEAGSAGFLRGIETLLRELPNRLGTVQADPGRQNQPETKPVQAPSPVDADKIANMPVKQLAADLFGEQRSMALMNN